MIGLPREGEGGGGAELSFKKKKNNRSLPFIVNSSNLKTVIITPSFFIKISGEMSELIVSESLYKLRQDFKTFRNYRAEPC